MGSDVSLLTLYGVLSDPDSQNTRLSRRLPMYTCHSTHPPFFLLLSQRQPPRIIYGVLSSVHGRKKKKKNKHDWACPSSTAVFENSLYSIQTVPAKVHSRDQAQFPWTVFRGGTHSRACPLSFTWAPTTHHLHRSAPNRAEGTE